MANIPCLAKIRKFLNYFSFSKKTPTFSPQNLNLFIRVYILIHCASLVIVVNDFIQKYKRIKHFSQGMRTILTWFAFFNIFVCLLRNRVSHFYAIHLIDMIFLKCSKQQHWFLTIIYILTDILNWSKASFLSFFFFCLVFQHVLIRKKNISILHYTS